MILVKMILVGDTKEGTADNNQQNNVGKWQKKPLVDTQYLLQVENASTM